MTTAAVAIAISTDEDAIATPAHVPRRGERTHGEGEAVPALAVRRPADHETEDDELGEGQHGRRSDLAELRRSPPDLDLDRRLAGGPEDADHAERREREQEHDRAGRGERRPQQRKGDLAEHAPWARAEGRRGGLEVGWQMLPDGADRANDDSQVEHDMGAEDRPDAAIERGGQQRGERRTHHDRRQHERGGEEPEQQPPADEPEPGEHVRRGDADDERQHRARQRLPGGEPRHLPCAGSAETSLTSSMATALASSAVNGTT